MVCTAISHRDAKNPLRRNGRLSAIHAIEYAGQAAALHCALSSPKTGKASHRSLLAAVNEVRLAREFLDDLPAPLRISVRRELALGPGTIYRFAIESNALSVADGRLFVMGRVALEP